MKEAERIAALESEVAALKDWQQRQNGSIARTESKVDKLLFFVMMTLGGIIANLIITLVR